jgi:hypothetical protein
MATTVVLMKGNVVAVSFRFDESHEHMDQVLMKKVSKFHQIDHAV